MTTAWASALRSGRVQVLGRLLDAGAEIDSLDDHGQTALMCAARDGQIHVVRLLVGRGAALNHKAKYSLTGLMLAVLGGHAEIVRVLVEAGADVTVTGTGAPGFAGKTALDLAVQRNDVEVQRMIDARSG